MDRIRVRRPEAAQPKPASLEQGLRRQMAWAAGTEQFQHRDPLYHVTENFQQTFDAMGRRHAAQMDQEQEQEQSTGPGQAPQTGDLPDKTSARSFYERSQPDDQDMIRRFSETAFQRGTLSGAVLRGTGQMMLFSCLKKTIGQSQPTRWQQQKLFEKASPMRNVPGHNPDRVVFNRGFTDSAVGINRFRAIALAAKRSGLMIIASPSCFFRYSASSLYSGVRTRAMTSQCPDCFATIQQSRFSSSAAVTAISTSA